MDLCEDIDFNDLADYNIHYTSVLANGKVNNSRSVVVRVNSAMLLREHV